MATVLVVGQERCGTHTLANMLGAAGMMATHESVPTLCEEARARTLGTAWDEKVVSAKAGAVTGKAEANHRLQFFVDKLADIEDAKFLFLVRDPARVVASMMGTFAHWPELRADLPGWYRRAAAAHVPAEKREFNLYRIPYALPEPLPVRHLRAWVRGLGVSLPLLASLGDRLRLVRTVDIPKCRDVWNWLGLPWTASVAQTATIRTDTMYRLFGGDNVAAWAEDQVRPYADQIRAEFVEALAGLPLGPAVIEASRP